MRRVFIQTSCKYPHGEALANYIQSLSKAILNVGYEVILVTGINEEYAFEAVVLDSEPIKIVPIMSKADTISKQERITRYCDERIKVLEKYEIDREDRVIVFEPRNEYFLNRLFEKREKTGFKVICAVLELFSARDYRTRDDYERSIYIRDEVFLQADAILSISEYIDEHYMNKGMRRVYRFPPMIDSLECSFKVKETDRYRFIIPSKKDSVKSMLTAFAGLKDEEAEKVEIHISGIEKEYIEKIMDQAAWRKIVKYTIIHPWVRYDELVKLYQQVDFLLIARDECQRTLANFPSKVPETMAYGIVPIVSDVGDYTKYYLKDGKDSIFIDGDDADAVRIALEKAIRMSAAEYMCYSKNARKTAEERFDYRIWDLKIKRMLESV